MVTPSRGRIRLAGEEIAGENPVDVLRRGCSYVPQGRCNFPAMSVEENLEMGAYTRADASVRRDIEAMLERFPMLGTKRREPAGTLSGGQQQILEIAIALLLHPRILLIGQPSLALDPRMVELLVSSIVPCNRAGSAGRAVAGMAGGWGPAAELDARAPCGGALVFGSRFVVEQWITFPRFVLTGAWSRSFRAR